MGGTMEGRVTSYGQENGVTYLDLRQATRRARNTSTRKGQGRDWYCVHAFAASLTR